MGGISLGLGFTHVWNPLGALLLLTGHGPQLQACMGKQRGAHKSGIVRFTHTYVAQAQGEITDRAGG